MHTHTGTAAPTSTDKTVLLQREYTQFLRCCFFNISTYPSDVLEASNLKLIFRVVYKYQILPFKTTFSVLHWQQSVHVCLLGGLKRGGRSLTEVAKLFL